MNVVSHHRYTVRSLLGEGVQRLRSAGREQARLEAEVLLAEALGQPRAFLLAHSDDYVPNAVVERYRRWIERRVRGEPLAYILGYTWFYGLKIEVSPAVLVPREETEILVTLALQDLERRKGRVRIVDVGTGSGAIAVALAVYGHMPVIATDVSAPALYVAKKNVQSLAPGKVSLVQGDLIVPLVGPFHLVVANLPYVGWAEREVVAPEVRAYEPNVALWAGRDGLALLQRLLAMAPSRVTSDATLLLEIGYRQGASVAALARRAFPNAFVHVHQDWGGQDRVVEIRCRK